MSKPAIYILGGQQSDFSRNIIREGSHISELFIDTVSAGLESAQLDPSEIEVGHVGNFVAPLFTGQAHLGGFFGHVHPDMAHMPASSHEAACASGTMALLAAMANLEAGRYGLACVVGLEVMRNVSSEEAGRHLRTAAWADKEWQHTPYLWPCAFDDMIGLYDERYGVDKAHLAAISQQNFANGRSNPNAQTRKWAFNEQSFSDSDDKANPSICGRIRRQDCSQVTDGAAVVFLATEERAREYAKKRGIDLASIPQVKGWGHINAPLLFDEKMRQNQSQEYILPHVRELFRQTLGRANMEDIHAIDGMEVHDCFNITEYMILDHSGLYAPGEAWKAIEAGDHAPGGRLPINLSGGLIAAGHPVGATGVRMALDCYKQVTASADGYQLEGARNMMTINLGGSTTTCASLIIGR
ncbi:MAG: acetyl-CoA acetyltransferase [Bermanella sp.]